MLSSPIYRMFNVWRPHVPESVDGEPLTTKVADFADFPYERLPENVGVSIFMRPGVVICLLVFYLLSEAPLKAVMKATNWDPKWNVFRYFIAFHNLVLAIFSAACAYNSWPIVLQHFMDRGFMATYCDIDGALWGVGGLGAWSTVFYISKYYEFLDTWILILKGKEASFLQVYHHTGIALIMYLAVASQSAWLLFVVLLNSFIHTLMYVYFFIKTISPAVEIKAAKYLTMAQITQFFMGIAGSFGVLLMGETCDSQSSRFALACLHVYGYGLIALFMAFANRKYKKA